MPTPEDSADSIPAGLAEALADCLELERTAREAALAELERRFPGQAERLRRAAAVAEEIGIDGVDDRGLQTVPLDGTDPLAGRIFGHYRIGAALGGGGMGVVHRALDLRDGRTVALKIVRPELLFFTRARDRFRREVEAVAKLDHPGLVRILDQGETDGVPWFAMEMVEGATLAEVIEESRRSLRTGSDPEPLDRVLGRILGPGTGIASSYSGDRHEVLIGLFAKFAEALDQAHAKGLVHRDLKPSNMMLGADGGIRLIDFGLVMDRDAPGATASGLEAGSLPYMAPERLRGAAAEPASDLWSMGVTLHEAFALERPFSGPDLASCRQSILDADAPRLGRSVAGLPRDLENLVAALLAPEIDLRPRSAAVLATALRRILAGEATGITGAGPWRRLRRSMRRRPTRFVAAGAALLLLIFAAHSIISSSVNERRIAAERRRLGDEAARREDRESTLRSVLRVVDPDAGKGANVTARDVLDAAVKALSPDGSMPPDLLVQIGTAYFSLGHLAEARRQYETAISAYEERDGGAVSEAYARLLVAYAALLTSTGDENSALAATDRLLERLRLSDGDADGPAMTLALRSRGQLLYRLGRFEEAREPAEQAYAMARRVFGAQDRETLLCYLEVATIESLVGDVERAESQLRAIIGIFARSTGSGDPILVDAKERLAILLFERRPGPEAVSLADEVLAAIRGSRGNESPDLARVLRLRAMLAFIVERNLAGARGYLEEALALSTKALGPAHRRTLVIQSTRADLELNTQNYSRARTILEDAIASLEGVEDERRQILPGLLDSLAAVEGALGEDEDADDLSAEAFEKASAWMPPGSLQRLKITERHAERLLAAGRADVAEQVLRSALQAVAATGLEGAVTQGRLNLVLARTLESVDRKEEALDCLEKAWTIFEKERTPGNDLRIRALSEKGLLLAARRPEEGIAVLRKALDELTGAWPKDVEGRRRQEIYLGVGLSLAGRFEEAQDLVVPALRELEATSGLRAGLLAEMRSRVAGIYRAWGRPGPDVSDGQSP